MKYSEGSSSRSMGLEERSSKNVELICMGKEREIEKEENEGKKEREIIRKHEYETNSRLNKIREPTFWERKGRKKKRNIRTGRWKWKGI